MSWIKGVLIAIDQLGNAIAGGNPDATISARTGYFANAAKSDFRYYWVTMEYIIDFSFYPIDGPNHCYESYLDEKDENIVVGSDFMRAILGLIIIVASSLIAVTIRFYVLIFPKAKYNYKFIK